MGKFTYGAQGAQCDWCETYAWDYNPHMFFHIGEWIEEDDGLGKSDRWTFCGDRCREEFYEQLYLR